MPMEKSGQKLRPGALFRGAVRPEVFIRRLYLVDAPPAKRLANPAITLILEL